MIPRWHRAYVRSHPLGLCISLGFFTSGAIGLLAPSLVKDSAPALTLPTFVLVLFNIAWLVGGFLASVGLLRGRRDLEIPGMALIAGGMTAYFATVVSIRAISALAAVFMAFLAIGCAARAWTLLKHGYDGILR